MVERVDIDGELPLVVGQDARGMGGYSDAPS